MLACLLLDGCGGEGVRLVLVSDECQDDDAKIYPGICGCGVAEEQCVPLQQSLVHRYAFDGTGAVAVDDVGGADGEIVNAVLSGRGQLDLDRTVEQYVDLPNGIVSVLTNATFEAWVVWAAPEPTQFWERIFDFGVSTAGEGLRDRGQSYLFLAPAQFRTAYKNLASNGEILIDATDPFPVGQLVHVAVVVDEQGQELRLYLNALEQGRVPLGQSLGTVQDVNNWLGRSQFANDTRFGGSFLEFRMYAAALSPQQLEHSRRLGPSPAFLARPAEAQEPSEALP